jgi:crotonobetainyl-CoA:carnitine CoA-transferase CaiB-like acyl-CoA transferase
LPALAADARFNSNALRVGNRAALDAIIAPLFKSRPAEHWIGQLRAADILCGTVNTFADVIADEDLAACLPLIEANIDGVARMMGNPLRIDGDYFSAARPAPARGEHTREVLAELGFSADEVESFLRSGGAFALE